MYLDTDVLGKKIKEKKDFVFTVKSKVEITKAIRQHLPNCGI